MRTILCLALVAASGEAAISPGALQAAAAANAPVVREGADVEAIRAIGRRWRELYNAGRFEEIADLYTADTMVMPRGRPRISGRDEMRRAVGGLAAGRRVDITVTEREAFVAGDYGWFVGDFRVSYTPREPNAAPVIELGRSLVIFRRDADGQWRIHRDMDNPAPPTAARSAGVAAATTETTPPLWNPASRTVATECDRLASSRYDRTRLAKPVAREEIDVPAAIAQCETDLRQHPGDPRVNFHLGRLYGYAGDAAKTLAHRRAAAAGNHNAMFLLGYLAWNATKDDVARCAAAREMKLAADRGNYSAQIIYASYRLEGRLDACANQASAAEVAAYLKAASSQADGFFETRFAEHLIQEVEQSRGEQ